MRLYASDNNAGVCPEAWAALVAANEGSSQSYGQDVWTARVTQAFHQLFETELSAFIVSTGTAANALALSAMCQPFHSVVCTPSAHIETNECSAVEFFSGGAKLLPVAARNGKLTAAAVHDALQEQAKPHRAKPRAISLSQTTENGLVYTPDEIRDLSAVCRDHGLKMHMDGARFANACAALGCSPADLTWRVGIDVLCFGGTKNGLAIGEAILFFDPALASDFAYRRKQAGQLASKMRFLAAPWAGLIESGAWLRNARHANACATRLAGAIEDVAGVELRFPTEANAVFLSAHDDVFDRLRIQGWQFHASTDRTARFMFAWDTPPSDIDLLVRDIRQAAGASAIRRTLS